MLEKLELTYYGIFRKNAQILLQNLCIFEVHIMYSLFISGAKNLDLLQSQYKPLQ